jgi:hypothetical protein
MTFAISGMFLFGRRMFEFSNFEESMVMCFRILLGDFDWGEMSKEHPVTAFLWFFLNMILMNLLMLNMLMAIIMDTYSEVKADASSSKVLWEQLFDLVVDGISYMQGKLATSNKLLEALDRTDAEELDEAELIEAVGPALSRGQAEHLIAATKQREDDEANKGVTISQAMKMIGWVRLAVQKIGWQLELVMVDQKAEVRQVKNERKDVVVESDICLSDSEGLLDMLEARMEQMDKYMRDSHQYISNRGKDAKIRLTIIEDLIRSERDAASLRVDHAEPIFR